MSTTLATKQDLQLLATKTEFMALREDVQLLKQEMASMRTEFRQDVGNGYTLLLHEINGFREDFSRDLKTFERNVTVSLGSMMIVGFGLTITALRVWL
ncbi:MAG: hypothetical protein ACRES3_07175 [Steroidobacteraceae bacterium]